MAIVFAHKKASNREAAEQLQAKLPKHFKLRFHAMAANSDVYAVVDKSKKRKNRSPAEKELAEEPVSPIYDMATTDMDYKPAPKKNEGLCAEYSRINFIPEKTNLQQEVELENSNPGSKASKEEAKNVDVQTLNKASVYKSLACIFPTIIAVIAILICIISIAYFSAEISELKTRNTSIQQSPFGQQTELMQADLLRQLNSSIDKIYSLLKNKTNQLNSSVDTIFSILDNRINQVNWSIDHLCQQIKPVIENNTIELGNTNFAFQNYISQQNEVNSALANQLNSTEMGLSQNISVLEYRSEELSGIVADLLASSCAALLPTNTSGYYWVSASNGSAVRVYCDMTRSCDGVTGGWVRVGYLDMTDSSHQCPSGFTEHSDSNIRTCRRANTSAGCESVMMDVPYQYSRVCGGVRAYQVGTTNAFQGRSSPSIDIAYVDGVSLTHGSPRQHIWTFVSGLQESRGDIPSVCPCTNARAPSPPAFVGNDYFCDSGNPLFMHSDSRTTVYSTDPLWDGRGCVSSTCCTFNNPPWFYKQLSDLTTDDIEMRVCIDQDAEDENVLIEMVEIYVQ